MQKLTAVTEILTLFIVCAILSNSKRPLSWNTKLPKKNKNKKKKKKHGFIKKHSGTKLDRLQLMVFEISSFSFLFVFSNCSWLPS